MLFKDEEARHVMIIDITKKKAEEQIRLSEERFRALVENGHDAMIQNEDFS